MRRFQAGCGRVCEGPDEGDLAYMALAYPECPSCEHRLEPEGAPSFCRWRLEDAPHPFAALSGLREVVE